MDGEIILGLTFGSSTSISNSLDGSRRYHAQLTVHVRVRLPSIPRITSEVSLEFEGQQQLGQMSKICQAVRSSDENDNG